MQRIGLIGSDNSHVARFTEILNLEDHPAYWPDSGATVHAIWGDDEELTVEEARKGRIPVVASSPEEVAESCDLVFATSRRPGVHVAHARPAIETRKPLFVDKPLAQTPDQCRELIALAEDAGNLMTSFSTLRYGSAANAYRSGLSQAGPVKFATYMGPCTRKNDYGGILFYGIHVAELMQEFHGADVVSVEAVESPAGGDPSNISAACTYEDGTLVTLGLIGEGRVHIPHARGRVRGDRRGPGYGSELRGRRPFEEPGRGPGDQHAFWSRKQPPRRTTTRRAPVGYWPSFAARRRPCRTSRC